MKSFRIVILLAAIVALSTGCWTTKRVLHELKWSGQEPVTEQTLPETDVTPG
jgi:hypothetical protein